MIGRRRQAPTTRPAPTRMSAMLRTKRAIERSIEEESRQLAPCSLALLRLERERGALIGQIERLRSVRRAQLASVG